MLTPPVQYLKNLEYTQKKRKATGNGNGVKNKKNLPIDLDAEGEEVPTTDNYDLNARQKQASTDINNVYKKCKTGRCNGPCVQIAHNHCNPVRASMLSTLIDAIASDVPPHPRGLTFTSQVRDEPGVTVSDPPKLPMFDIWPGRKNASPAHSLPTSSHVHHSPMRSPRRSHNYYRSPRYHPRTERRYYDSSPDRPYRDVPAARPPAPAMIIALNSSNFASLQDPSIPDFLTSLHLHPDYARRNLDILVPHFESRDFYSIRSLAAFDDMQLMQRVPEVSSGNASFIVGAIAQYLRSLPV